MSHPRAIDNVKLVGPAGKSFSPDPRAVIETERACVYCSGRARLSNYLDNGRMVHIVYTCEEPECGRRDIHSYDKGVLAKADFT